MYIAAPVTTAIKSVKTPVATIFSGHGTARPIAICTSVAANEQAMGPKQLTQKRRNATPREYR